MSSILDTLYNIFKGANPDKSDEEINTQVKSYAQDPNIHEALKDFLPATPDTQTEEQPTPPKTTTSDNLSVSPDVMSSKLPPANAAQSSFDVKESTSPVTMNGVMPSMPTGNVAQPNPDLPVSMPPNPPIAPIPEAAKITNPKEESIPIPHAGEAPLAQNLSDNDERQKMLAEEAKKRKLGAIPLLIGGAGDAISTAATAFGAQAGTPVLDKIADMEAKNIKGDKEQFEENLKNDPTSDVSRSYQKIISMMMGKPATDPDIQKMSAKTIAAQLPEVEKFMAKELGLKQIQANKELSLSMQKGNERDRMWNQAVQTINQIRGDKPLVDSEVMRNGAISAYQAIDHIQKQGRSPNQYEYVDLLGQLWKARTGATLTNEELKHMDAKTIQSQLGPIGTYFTGDPKAITTPGATNAIKDFVIQSGKTADQIHDNYMQTRGVGAAATRMKDLYPDDADRLSKMARGMSFSDATGLSYKNPAKTNPSSVPTIINQQDYTKLPPGASYQDASGKVYRKK